MSNDERPHRRRPEGARPDVAAIAMGAAAIFAPASLTGMPVVDAIERALLVAFIAWTGAHGRRWPWLIAGVLIAVPARDTSLYFALAGLAVVVAAAIPKRRNRVVGAVGLGLLANAVLWYPPSVPPLGLASAAAGCILVVISGFHYMRNRKRRMVRVGMWAVGTYVLLATVAVGVAVALAFGQARAAGNASQAALQAARDGDAERATNELAEAGDAFAQASGSLDGFLAKPAVLVPGLAQQLEAVQVTVDEGRRITDAGDDIVAAADYESLQYQGRLDLDQVVALQEPTRVADDVLRDAGDHVGDVQEGSLLPPLRSQLESFSQEIEEAQRTTAIAADLMEITPGLFGKDGQRRFLVIFTTPAEQRGGGGFIGNFAELTATDGDVELTRSGRIKELIDAAEPGTRSISGPEDYLSRYGRFEPWDYQQDATLSPDFPSVSQVMSELYPQSGGQPVDGVIGLDPAGLATLLELTGPVAVPGLPLPLTAVNAEQILTKSQYVDVPDDAERGEILTEAVRVTFDKLTDATLPTPRKLSETLSPAARAGHLRVWSPNQREQETFEELGADGTLALPAGDDGFKLVQQNVGNNKLDAYLSRTLAYRTQVDAKTGKVTSTLRVKLTNNVPSVDLPRAVVGNNRGYPRGTNLAWYTLYTPHLLTSATINGERQSLASERERGLNAYDTPFVPVKPGETVVMDFELEGGIDLRDGYHLTVLPQQTVIPDVLDASIGVDNGTTAQGDEATVIYDLELGPPVRETIELTN